MTNLKYKEIQVVAFAAPYPPNYGGVIDVYFRLKALKDLGVKVHLHTFIYDEHQPSSELERICSSVQYYKRSHSPKYLKGWPYIISSRYDKSLIEQVVQKGCPVLLEGLHTCFLMDALRERGIPFSIRMHNVEWKYYQYLAELEASFIKKRYFLEEAKRLKIFENKVDGARLLAISERDMDYFKKRYPTSQVIFIPPFHSFDQPDIKNGVGTFTLFHGNLSINENEQAAIWLIEKVFLGLKEKLVIAGKNPGKRLMHAANAYDNIKLLSNPSNEQMKRLMSQAQVHVLPIRQPTGMKIKWVNALYSAKFILTNQDIYDKQRADMGVYIAQSAPEFKQQITQLHAKIFTEENLQKRKEFVGTTFDNLLNAQKLFE